MAWDSTTRRRQNSNASGNRRSSTSRPTGTATPAVIPSTNPHLSDPVLALFLASNFDPAAYLNSTLPSLKPRTTTTSSSRSSTPASSEATLADLSAHTQTLLGQLSAHTSRLTNNLTELTDAILRSGARLGYEVEVLRGEARGLSEVINEKLQDDIAVFIPGGLESTPTLTLSKTRSRRSTITAADSEDPATPAVEQPVKTSVPAAAEAEAEYISKLRTLTTVRARLDTVLHTFDSALNWTFPPSEVSVSSGLISVSAPEPGSEAASVEEKGQEVSKKVRAEIMELLSEGRAGEEGIKKARERVEELRGLCEVWKGTAEERGRGRFVDGLARLVDEKEKELGRKSADDGVRPDIEKPAQSTGGGGGYGFINHLQKIRGGI